jgi:hypothetical protein
MVDGPAVPTVPAMTAPPAETLAPRAPAPAMRREVVGALAVLAIAAFAAVGFLLGRSGGDSEAAPPSTRNVAAGVSRLDIPATWRRAERGGRVPGLPAAIVGKDGTTAWSAPRAAEGRLVVGDASNGNAAVLDARLSGSRPGRATIVRLGDAEAVRYLSAGMAAYAVPHSRGIQVLACVGSPGSTFRARCDGVVTTLAMAGAEAVSLQVSRPYARRLDRTLDRLRTRRNAGVARLRAAKRPQGQAEAATDIGAAYVQAEKALGKPPANPFVRPLHAGIAQALTNVRQTYHALGQAAGNGKRAAYNRERRRIPRAERRLRAAVTALARWGYIPR